MKNIGFLSFGHWSDAPGSQVRSASDSLLQSIELAVAAEEIGADGAYFRVHHFAQQLGSPFPLLAAAGARTQRIELGTAVIDMRYENPLYMAEDAGAADLIAGGRLQLGISRGSPEQVIDGWRYFGYRPGDDKTDADMARDHAEVFLEVLKGDGFAQPNPRPMFHNPPGLLRVEPHSPGPARPHLVGRGLGQATAVWAAKLGMNLQSSTLKNNESDRPLPRPAGQADPGLPRRVEGSGPRARAPGLGQPLDLRADRRARLGVLRRPQPGRGPGRLHRRGDPGDLRPDLRRRAGQAHRAAQGGRGHRRRRHPAAHGPQPARASSTTRTRSSPS